MNRQLFLRVTVFVLVAFALIGQAGSVLPTSSDPGAARAAANATAPRAAHLAPPGQPDVVLYDQYDYISTLYATYSQKFEPYMSAYDCYLADDFVVPAGEMWSVSEVQVHARVDGNGQPDSFNVVIYTDTGMPGPPVYTANSIGYSIPAQSEYVIPLSAPVVLGPGTYWLMVQANMSYSGGGWWRWTNRGLRSNAHYAAWQNPNEGFNSGCDTWTSRWQCLGDLTNPDQVFRILGSSFVPTPTPTAPTRTPTRTATPAPTVTWSLDDGSTEESFGLNINGHGIPFIAINRFTPELWEWPLIVTGISIQFPDPAMANLDLTGRNIDLLVYRDTDGTGDPTNATKIFQQTVTVQVADGVTFSNYAVDIPIAGPGDVYVGFSNTYDHGGTVRYSYPGPIDQSTQNYRSWIATNYTGADPDYNDLANNTTLTLIDNMGMAYRGNWVIRASVVPFNTPTPTPTDIPVDTPTSTATATATATSVPPVVLRGQVLLPGRPAPPHPCWSVPLTLTLSSASSTWEYTGITTDQYGSFTVTAPASGTYDWRVKNSKSLANAGIVTLVEGTNDVELGLLRAGDADDNNCVGIADFNVLRLSFGKVAGQSGYDPRADFNDDNIVNILDFSLLRASYGLCGAGP
jgi:hypothetical protein